MSRTQLPPLLSSMPLETKSAQTKEFKSATKSYSLSSTNIKYMLPAVSTLQPCIDSKPGNLDTWPAHAEGPRPPSLGPEWSQKPAEFMPKGNYKPKFLDQLESFLKKELRALGCVENKPSEKRLQAFREAFEYLIEDFKTYRPLLSAIKNEYEMMIIHQREKIRELEPLKTMLVTVSEQCEKTLLAMKEEEKGDLQEMKKENGKLLEVINSLRENELTLKAQVEKLQEELASEYLKYRNECDARKMLIADMNDLRAQQEDASKNSMLETETADGKKEDATFLRLALKKAREDIEAKNLKLAKMEADYGDVVPRREHEKLSERFQTLEKDKVQLQKDHETLMKEHSTLLEVQRKTEEERKEYAKECENMRRCATPRPRWDKCGRYVEGGDERWKELANNKTSDELVDVLLAEMTGTDIAIIQAGVSAGEEFFDGQGTGANVPKYLRFEGKVRNRRMNKRDVLLLIKDVWQERMAADTENTDAEHESLSGFLYSYFERRFGAENMAFEWAYNLQDACQRYQHVPRVGLFFGILSGEIDEALYFDQRALVEKLSNELSKADEGNGEECSVSKEVFEATLRKCFSLADSQTIDELMKLAEEEISTGNILYKKLLTEDDEGGMGPFAEKLLDHDRMERIAYVKDIEEVLEGKGEVTEEELRQAFLQVDPELPASTLDQYVLRGCYEVAAKADGKMETASIVKRLQTGSVRRFGKTNK